MLKENLLRHNPTQPNPLSILAQKVVAVNGSDYAFKQRETNGKLFWDFRCLYFTHNEAGYDRNPSAWATVEEDGRITSGCWVCKRRQFVYHDGEWQPAPTLHTLSRNDPRLRKVLLGLGCTEFPAVGAESGDVTPKVGFPVTYADATQGFHFRIALEGKGKWRHQQSGKTSEAVFALHHKKILEGITRLKYVVITESPLDAAVLIAAGFPSIAVLGCNNAGALACELHRKTLLEALGDDGLTYVWQENDAPQFAQAVAQALQRSVKVISLPDPDQKDAFRLWLANGKDWGRFKEVVKDLLEGAEELAPRQPPQHPPTGSGEIGKILIPDQVFKRLGDITVQHTEWLVPDYLPIGVVTLLAGEGGHGKTTLISNLVAAIIKGDKWLNKFKVPQGCVIWIVTEGIDEIRNKLLGYGITDSDPMLFIDLTVWEGYTPLRAAQSLPELLRLAKERLEANFGDIPIRLVALDCMRGFGFDEKQASRQKGDRLPTVREIYNPLTEFAQREGAAVIVTHHFRKLQPDERRRLYPKRKKGKEIAPEIDINLLRNLIAGTTDLVNAARHALVVVSDLEAGTALLVPVKSNRSQGLGLPIKYDWQADAPTFLNFVSEDETVIERAIAFLKRVLAEGAKPSSVVKELAEREGISNRTLWRAKARLGVCAFRQNGEWFWALSPEINNFGTDAPKPQQNKALSSVPTSVPTENGFGTVGIVGSEPSVPSVPNPKPIGTDIGTVKNPINTRVSGQVCQVCQTFPNSSPTDSSPQPTPAPENSHNYLPQQKNGNNSGNLGAGRLDDGWRWGLLADGLGILPELLLTNPEPPEPEPPTQPDPQPDHQPAQTLQHTVLSEPVCPYCAEPLEPERGLAACVGCGRMFTVPKPDHQPDPQPAQPPTVHHRELEGEVEGELEAAVQLRLFLDKLLAVEAMKAEGGRDEGNPPSAGSPSPTTEPSANEPPASPPSHISSPPPVTELQQNLFEPPAVQAEPPSRLTAKEGEKIVLRSGSSVVVCEPEALRSAAKPIAEIPDLHLPQAPTNFNKVFPVVIDIEAEPLQPDANPQDFRKQKILAIGVLVGSEKLVDIIHGANEFETLLKFSNYIRGISKVGYAQGKTHYIFVGHNLLGYDIPLLIERYKVHRLTPPFDFVVDKEGKVVEVAVANTQGVISSSPLTYRKVKSQGLLAEWDFADTLHLVLKYDSVFREMTKHDLKSAAQHFGLSVENREELSTQEIVDCFYNDPQRFEAYLKADLIEAYRLFMHLAPPYFYLAQFINSVLAAEGALKHKWKIEDAIQRSTAAMIETLLEAHYKSKPQPEEKRSYEGGLVLCRSGVYWQAAKVDIASLYPNIMLVYRIHSKKDREGWMLKVLKHLTAERLRLKSKAKEGDKEAEHMQQALKVLINSVYGFYGTGGYSFNDMQAAETVTRLGREILTLIIYTIEEAGGVVAEADTDGVIFSHHNPQQVVEAINAALPEGFKVELEWHGCVAFISDKKNYIVFNPDSTVKEIKGAKWRGRDKPKLRTTFVVDYLREYLFNSPQAAQKLVKDIAERIYNNAALELVAVTRKVGRNEADKFLKKLGAQEGQVVTFVYTNKKKNEAAIITPENAGSVRYDIAFYSKLLAETLKEINAVLAKQVCCGCGCGGGAGG